MGVGAERRAARWNTSTQAVVAVGQLAVTLALVRLLDPAEFGRVALVYLVAGLVALFDDGGFSTALIARDERDGATLNVVFYQEVLVGLALAGVVAAAAPALAVLYRQPDLTGYLLVLAPVFVITGPRRFYQSIFQRDLTFRGMGIVRIAATGLFVAGTLGLAWCGAGVWSLVVGLGARMAVESAGFVYLGRRRFWPGRPPVRAWRTGYGRIGLAKVGERLLNYLIDRLDLLIIGRVLGAEALGVYDVFKRLGIGVYQQVIPALTRIAIPRLARLQSQPELLARAYARQLEYVGYILFPAYLFQAVFAEPLVAVVFGAQWVRYAPVFAWISLLLMVRGTSGPVDALLMARGLVRRELYYAVVVVVVLAVTLLYAVGDGLEATVTAVTYLYVGLTVPIYLWVVRPASYVGRVRYFRALGVPLGVAGVATGVARWTSDFLVTDSAAILTIGLLAATLVFTAGMLTVDAGARRTVRGWIRSSIRLR